MDDLLLTGGLQGLVTIAHREVTSGNVSNEINRNNYCQMI